MKQLLQNLGNGKTELVKVPIPSPGPNEVIIQSVNSLISAGTERMLVSFGKANPLDKIRQQPERVKQVYDKIKTDGLFATINTVRTRLEDPIPLGYSNAGIVLSVGEYISDISPGVRVVSNGSHAEIVCVPRKLVARIPDNVMFEEASFTVVASIALQGLRLVNPTMGETIVVIGLGLIGQLAVQLAIADGCRVIGYDIDQEKVDLAAKSGALAFKAGGETDPVMVVLENTKGMGADAVLITASAEGNAIISQAAGMSRKRGRVVLVGVVGLDLNRKDFYEKELTFQVSCSYGPGRYDPNYEEKGHDYPFAYVRWTEGRNFEAVLDALHRGRLKVKPLISRVVDFNDAVSVYDIIAESKDIATVFKYNSAPVLDKTVYISVPDIRDSNDPAKPSVAVIGGGLYTKSTLMPLLIKTEARIKSICSHSGASSTALAKKFRVPCSTTDFGSILNDKEISSVMITTRHNLHAPMTIDALRAGKKVFVEKPLAITRKELDEIVANYSDFTSRSSPVFVMVGFNRRFSSFTVKAKELTGNGGLPVNVIITVNAGALPDSHWTKDLTVGGGRVVGEACHFIDLFRFLCNSRITSVCASSMGLTLDKGTDNVMILLKAENGSQASINYLSNGNKKYPKEEILVFSQEKIVQIYNFRKMTGFGFKRFSSVSGNQDKGHGAEIRAFFEGVKTGIPPIPFREVVNVTEASFAVLESLQSGAWVKLRYT